MTAATKIERSGPAIRAALTEFAPAECEEFEAEFRQALAPADADFDLGHVDAVLDRWGDRCDVRQSTGARVEQLLEWPEGPREAYDARRDRWTTTYGDGVGPILYAVIREQRQVLILRLA